MIEHGAPVTFRLGATGSEVRFWIEEDPVVDLDADAAASERESTNGSPRRAANRYLGPRPFQAAKVPVALTIEDLTVDVVTRGSRSWSTRPPATKRLVEDVSFVVEPGQLVAVIGPSGAGKSTVMKAVNGDCASSGLIRYNGTPLTAESAPDIRRQIAYVPQSDILHTSLTLREALIFTAKLRLPTLADDKRALAVDRVLEELLLTEQADSLVGDLSGGERKRACVATELMTEPAVLFLDEPTTGLDPDAERLLVRLVKRLAVEGRRTVLMVTHSAAALAECDRLVVVGKSSRGIGRVAFVGPPAEVTKFFGVGRSDFAGVYQQVRTTQHDWSSRFRSSLQFRRYVLDPLQQHRAMRGLDESRSWTSPARQALWLSQRAVKVVVGQEQYLRLLIWQAPLAVLLLQIALGLHNLDGDATSKPRMLLIFTTIAALAMGLVNSSREIVKETDIVQRERTVGMSVAGYLGSKVLVMGALALAQSLVLTAAFFGQGGLRSGLLANSRIGDVVIILFVSIFCASSAGLAISAAVSSPEAAMVLLPIALVAELLLSGAFLNLGQIVTLPAAATPSYWVFTALAASNDLNRAEGICLGGPPPAGVAPPVCGTYWSHDMTHVAWPLIVLSLMSTAFLLLAARALGRKDAVL